MKRSLLFSSIAFLCLSTILSAQPPAAKLDSLSNELKKDQPDTSRVKTLQRFAFELLNTGMFDSVRVYAQQGLDLIPRAGLESYRHNLLNVVGISYFYQGNIDEARQNWEQALSLARKYEDKRAVNNISMNLGNVQQTLGNYPAAQAIYFECLAESERTNDMKAVSGLLGNIAVVFGLMGEYEKSLDFLGRQEALIDSFGSVPDKARWLVNMCEALSSLKKYDEAERRANELIQLSAEHGFLPGVAGGHGSLANMKTAQNMLEEAEYHLRESTAISKMMGDVSTVADNQGRMANIYLRMADSTNHDVLQKLYKGDWRKILGMAKTYTDSSMMYLTQTGDLRGLMDAHSMLTQIHERLGNYREAYFNHLQVKTLSDSLLNSERDKKITQTAMQYEFDKKEAAAKAEQEKKDIRQATIRNSSLAGMGGAIIFLLIVYRQRNRIHREKERSDDLLLNILPSEVADELKQKGSADAKHFDATTVLFTDFVKFTEISEHLSPAELVAEIDACFKGFDAIIVKHGLEKIKTIGDSYMAACGLPAPSASHASQAIRAALDMNDFITARSRQKKTEGKDSFDIRIGLHSGPVVAGIVGVKKFQYDIWGDTVNTASRMESTSQPGRVHISQVTYDYVQNDPALSFTPREKVLVKGKGEMNTYFVERNGKID
jgi:class 3 adenylate cyclase